MSRIAMLVGDGYEDSEFQVPFEHFHDAGYDVVILGSEKGQVIEGKKGLSKIEIQRTPADVSADDFDALVIPGGNGPDKLRRDPAMVNFVTAFNASGKPVAAICHGPQLLVEAGLVNGRTLTSWPGIQDELIEAGAHWVDEPLVENNNLITSRKPDDLEVFCKAVMARLDPAVADPMPVDPIKFG